MDKLKIGVIGLPGKWSTETLADSIEKKTGFRLIIDMTGVALDLANRKLLYKGYNLCELDGLIIKKISHQYSTNTLDRLELLRVAEQAGVRAFNPIENTIQLVNRLSCTVTLTNADIPMPETCITEDSHEALLAVEQFGGAIFKPLFSTKARGMEVIKKDSSQAKTREKILKFHAHNPMMYIQKKLDHGGRDMGLIFLAGEYIGAYTRNAKADSWNTTIHNGGAYSYCQPSQGIIDIAAKAQGLFGMDYTTVDIAETKGGPVVFEVSAFGGIRGAIEGAGINAAELFVNHALTTLKAG